MIFIIISLAIALWLCFREMQIALAKVVRNLPLENNEAKTKSLVLTEFYRSLLSFSWYHNLSMAVLQLELKVRGLRSTLLRLSMSFLGFALILLWIFGLFQVSGLYIAGPFGLLYIGASQSLFFAKASPLSRSLASLFRGLFFFGLSYWIFEQTTRLSSQVMMVAHEYEWIFFLAQSDALSSVILFVVGVALTLIFQMEAWSFMASAVFLAAGLLAFNNALILVAAEVIGAVWFLVWSSRALSPSARKSTQIFAVMVSASVGLVVSLLILFKSVIFPPELNGLSEIDLRLQCFAGASAFVLISTQIASMVWGHFANQKMKDELEASNYQGLRSMSSRVVALFDRCMLEARVSRRLEVLAAQGNELKNSDYKGIPVGLKQKHEAEIKSLQQWLLENKNEM